MALLHIINGTFPLWAPNINTTNYVYIENDRQTVTKNVIYTETDSGIVTDPQYWYIPDVADAVPTPNTIIYNGQEGMPSLGATTEVQRTITTDDGLVPCLTSCAIMIGNAQIASYGWNRNTTLASEVVRAYVEYVPQSSATSDGRTVTVKVNIHLVYVNYNIEEYYDEYGVRHTYINGNTNPIDVVVNGIPIGASSPTVGGSGSIRLNNNMYVCVLSMSESPV